MRKPYNKQIFLAFFIFVCFFLTANRHLAQSTSYPDIMLIPFQPTMFLSDMDMSGKAYFKNSYLPKDYYASDIVRQSLDHCLFENLLLYFDIKRIYFYTTQVCRQDLDNIYKSIDYKVYNQRIGAYYRNFNSFTVFQTFGGQRNRWGVECIQTTGGKSRPVAKGGKLLYTDVEIADTSLIPYLNKRYGCDYYLFINEVELKTRFNVCMDLTSNIHQKDIVVHFTLLDNQGKRVTGGLVGTTYEPGSGSDIFELVTENVRLLSEMVVGVIRNKLGLTLRIDFD